MYSQYLLFKTPNLLESENRVYGEHVFLKGYFYINEKHCL